MILVSIILLATVPAATAFAGDVSIVINGRSHHFNSNYDWNENNYGVGLEYQFETTSRWKKIVMANGFRDSTDRMSYMAGAGLHRRLLETHRFSGFYIDAGINAFIMTREDVNDKKPFPGVLPSLSIGNRYGGFNLTYLPTNAIQDMLNTDFVDSTISGILFIQFKISLSQLLP
jgi:hypothetical protein